MEEHVFLNEDDVKVTSTRLITDSETYVINAITSIKNGKTEKNVPTLTLTIGGILIIIGLFFRANAGLITSGIIVLIVAAIIWFLQKETHKVIVSFSSGEHKVISDTNKDLIEKIIKALNDSIVFRG
jgi:xanthine/uracil/vitamin C permease (AzgA family)